MQGQTAGVISVAAILAITVSGFVPVLTTLNANAVPYSTVITTNYSYTAVQTAISLSASTSTTVITQQSPTIVRSTPFNIGPQTLQCGQYANSGSNLNVGTDASVSYSASNGLYMFIFNSGQYSAFTSSNGATTSPNEAEIDNQGTGSASFHISQSDTYYFVLWLKPGFFGCYGVSNVGITSTSSSATYQTTVNVYITQTNTQIYTYTVTSTVTLHSPSSYTTTLTSTTTLTCKQGWLQALLGCH